MKLVKKPIVFIVCSGLGRINRGYESFTAECFEALRGDKQFNLYLIKGGGKKGYKEIVIPNLGRNFKSTIILSKLLKVKSYLIEQLSFFFCLIPVVIAKKPSVIYYSDFILGTYLWHFRKLFKLNYKLLFSNGAPNGAPFKTEDHVQQLLPVYLNDAIEKGEPAGKQTLLPYGFNINIAERVKQIEQKEIIKKELSIPAHQQVVLSIGAVNCFHKRMNYIIDEVASAGKNFFLIILGQFENETPDIIASAKNKLPGRCLINNVSHAEVEKFYIAADYFVLASLQEGFGRVLIEALSYGLPCIVHDTITTKEVLQRQGIFIDMTKADELTKCLNEIKDDHFNRQQLIKAAYKYYSWDKLKNKYADMIYQQISSKHILLPHAS